MTIKEQILIFEWIPMKISLILLRVSPVDSVAQSTRLRLAIWIGRIKIRQKRLSFGAGSTRLWSRRMPFDWPGSKRGGQRSKLNWCNKVLDPQKADDIVSRGTGLCLEVHPYGRWVWLWPGQLVAGMQDEGHCQRPDAKTVVNMLIPGISTAFQLKLVMG